MKKKYQFFISSTFTDLIDERLEIIQTILRTENIPLVMEAFPAADKKQMDLIKGIIDQSDFYIVLVGGRYGSIDPESGKSYTELEYDYAVSRGIPILAFLKTDESITKNQKDTEQEKQEAEQQLINEKAQVDYLKGDVNIVVATIAFGMGIDKPDVRWVIHADPPNSFDELVQQWGRASRDGKHADAYLIYVPQTLNSALWLVSKTTPNPERLRIKVEKLRNFHSFCRSRICRRKQILAYFGEVYSQSNCQSCDICLKGSKK